MNQQDHDRRSLAWHCYVVGRMRSDESLLDRARETLARWMARGQMPNRYYLAQWKSALDAGIDAVAQLATAQGEHANALRQCSPISCIMPNEERNGVQKKWK